jgi:uncharacterized protein YbjT (DUF2867 family)
VLRGGSRRALCEPFRSLTLGGVIIAVMRILVTGVSGFVGSELVPRLASDGHELRALARDPASVPAQVSADVEIVRADALTGEGLDASLREIEVAYYLIHSMESPAVQADPFPERERIAAENFAAAATRAGVRRIVYLGGLLPRDLTATGARKRASGLNGTSERSPRPSDPSLSRHLASRVAVERILLGAVGDSVSLRASIVIGARSRSFRLLVHLVERMPVLTLPAWRRFRTQPIDARDVVEMLVASATAPVGGRHLDVGGPDVLSYGEMLSRIAELMLVGRPSLGFGVSATAVTGRVAAAIAGEDPALVVGLMESLQRDLLLADHDAAALLGVQLHSFDAAVEHALSEWERSGTLAAR